MANGLQKNKMTDLNRFYAIQLLQNLQQLLQMVKLKLNAINGLQV